MYLPLGINSTLKHSGGRIKRLGGFSSAGTAKIGGYDKKINKESFWKSANWQIGQPEH